MENQVVLADTAVLNQKLDALTALIEAQNRRLEALETSGASTAAEVQRSSARLEALLEHMQAQRQAQEEFAELRRDLTPIANQVVKLTIDELEEIGSDFKGEDLLFLLKRLLRDTNLLLGLFDRMEGAVELADEVQRLSRPAFRQAVETLDRLEQDGYFAFAQQAWGIAERIVGEFSPSDVEALGDNIVTILTTVKNLTQPQIMALTNNALQAIQTEPEAEAKVSMWALLKDLLDPKVRKGMARLINMVKVLADQPATPSKN